MQAKFPWFPWFLRGKRRALAAWLAWGVASLAILVVGLFLHHRRSHPHPVRVVPPVVQAPTGPVYPDPPGILIHHSDTPSRNRYGPIDAAWLDNDARLKGDSIQFEGKTYHIAYHYVILPDGTVQPGRPEHCRGAHCPKYNFWLGICLIGDFHNHLHRWPSTPTAEQKQALVDLCERLMSKYHIPPENVRRHGDVRDTYCPGRRFPFAEIQQQLRAYAAVHPETRPLPPPQISLGPAPAR